MQPSSYRFPETLPGKDRQKRNGDHSTYGQDDGRPRKPHGPIKKMIDQKLKSDTQQGSLYEKVKRSRQIGHPEVLHQDRKYFTEDRALSNNGNCQGKEPVLVCGREADQIQVKGNASTVKSQ